MSIAGSNPGPLLGRDAEIELLASLLDGVQGGGGALVLYGEPGTGKSRLLAVAAGFARERGFTVLSATGVQSEAHLPFAGLHQLVRPLRFRTADLPAAQRAALDAAFGLGQEPAPERFRIAMAVLDLLGEVATDAPLLVLAEDAQWLDRPTTEVLAPAEAITLLDASAQQLSPAIRDRLLSEAAGNPLALTELPITATRREPIASGSLPLTQRLEQAVAVTALQRAAELSPPRQRARRLLAAAELTFELGQRDQVISILREVEQLDPDPVERARATWIDEVLHTRPLGDATRAASLIATAEQAGQAGDRDLQLDMAWLVASRAWLVDPAPTARRVLIEAADRLGDPESAELRIVAIQAYADPFGKAPAVLERLREALADVHHDADAARFLGPAAVAVGAFDIAATFLGEAVEGLRTQGRLGHLPRMLTLQGSMAAQLADWGVAIPAAEEARRLATELREPQWVAAADTVDSIIAGIRGDQDAAERAAARAERIAVPTGASITVAFAQFGRILAALGAGRHPAAYEAAERLFDPASPAHHPIIACWLIGDLAEAGLHAGRLDEARARVKQVEAASDDIPGTCIAVGLLHARALLAQDPREASGRFDEALGTDLTHWPLQRARLLLAHGRWLRRQRRVAESRTPLRDARDAFDAMGCAAWGDQARRELRASGESSRRRDLAPSDQLTAQELQIAQLAAQGLSNRDIAQRLYLSHRTIGTHLYRIFPKLGITSRGELSSVLSARTAWPER